MRLHPCLCEKPKPKISHSFSHGEISILSYLPSLFLTCPSEKRRRKGCEMKTTLLSFGERKRFSRPSLGNFLLSSHWPFFLLSLGPSPPPFCLLHNKNLKQLSFSPLSFPFLSHHLSQCRLDPFNLQRKLCVRDAFPFSSSPVLLL